MKMDEYKKYRQFVVQSQKLTAFLVCFYDGEERQKKANDENG